VTIAALLDWLRARLVGEASAVSDALDLARTCTSPRPEFFGSPFETVHADVAIILGSDSNFDDSEEAARLLVILQSVADGGANRSLARALSAIFAAPSERLPVQNFDLFATPPAKAVPDAASLMEDMLKSVSSAPSAESDFMAGLLAEATAPKQTPVAETPVSETKLSDLKNLPPAERAIALHQRMGEQLAVLSATPSTENALIAFRADLRLLERLLWRAGYKTFRSLADACDEAIAAQIAARGECPAQLRAELQFVLDLAGAMLSGAESKRRTYYDHIESLNALRVDIEDASARVREARLEERQARSLAMQGSANEATRDTSKLSRLQLVFLREMGQHLNSMTRDLLMVEKDPGNSEVIFSLMRSAHSIKGGGAVAKYAAIARFAHVAEDLLVAFRDNGLRMSPAAINLTLRGVDALQILMEEAERGEVSDGVLTDQIAPQFTRLTEHVLANLDLYRDAPEDAEQAARESLGLAPVAAEAEQARKTETRYVTVDIAQLDTLMNLAADLIIGRTRLVANIETMRAAVDALGDFRHAMQLLDRRFRPALTETLASSLGSLAMAGRHAGHDSHTGILTDFESGEFARFTKLDVWRRDLREELNRLDVVSEGLGGFSGEIDQTVSLVSQIANDLQESITRTRMIPVGQVFERFPRAIRDLAEQLGKQVSLEFKGGDTPLDKTVIEELSDPLMHILRNATDHGLESPSARADAGKPAQGRIMVSARQTGNRVVIEIRDDGRGIDPARVRTAAIAKGLLSEEEAASACERDLIDLLMAPGFSTAEKVTDVSGRGVGLDVVAGSVRALRGTFAIHSQLGVGTTFTLTLPTTLAITQALLFHCAGERFALPLSTVLEVVKLESTAVHRIEGFPVLRLREALIPLVDLRSALSLAGENEDEPQVIIIGDADSRTGLVVGALIGREEIVVKNLGEFLQHVPMVAGATILADGGVTLILDAVELAAIEPEVRASITKVAPNSLAKPSAPPTPYRAAKSSPAAKALSVDAPKGSPPPIAASAPVLAKKAPIPTRPPSAGHRGTRTGNHVLVVDDSASIRTFVVAILESAGFRTTSAVDGVDALEKLARTEFDLILTDLEMPRMHGFELIAEVKNAPSHAHIPIVILTGRMGEKHSRKGLELGALAFLVKPFEEAELLDTIRQFILKGRT
jgi:chemosensory pili system protein ChpA (sensor histidine kinase/response regulator)